ncbi:hypothetical protein ANO11243_010390 [Dothideomycetidae sp. 11243]|nr:hypothetical protein ANO11243_010390 [fungal sp. No.11243]
MVHITQRSVRAANITCLVVASLFAILRLMLPVVVRRRFMFKDAWLAASYTFFLALCILYLVAIPVLSRVGFTDPNVIKDADFTMKAMFAAAMLLWLVLWSIKFSLLALYTNLLKRAKPVYKRVWWGIVVFTCLAFIASVLSLVFACGPEADKMFTFGHCLKKSNLRGSAMSLWLAFATDVLTDMMIMLFPINLIRKLNMPLKQKLSVIGIFCLGLICVATAMIRVFEVGKTINAEAVPDLPWLALWSIVEASIAVIVGCAAGFHEFFKKVEARRTGASSGITNSKRSWHGGAGGGDPSMRLAVMRSEIDPFDDDVASTQSQEHLTKPVVAATKNDIVRTRFTMIASEKGDANHARTPSMVWA